jgi:hypothetical protein
MNKPVVSKVTQVEVVNFENIFISIRVHCYSVIRLQQKSVVIPQQLHKKRDKNHLENRKSITNKVSQVE